ncbi:hypothetical protein [Alteriqipengyuania lutimaris]|nr:hypothetical protein [Alteriqipengyuania lutimaris]MBB3034021.1 hypothetical protein [Alteriqipengyuania lutimaris]
MTFDTPDRYWDRKDRREMRRRIAVAVAGGALAFILVIALAAGMGLVR